MNTYLISSTNSHHRGILFLFAAGMMLFISIVLSLCIGVYYISIFDVIGILSGQIEHSSLSQILIHIRIPRILGGILAGSSLAVSGALIQGVLDNPLSSPNIIGVNTGAGFFVLAASIGGGQSFGLLPLAAFVGALFSALIVLVIGSRAGGEKLTIILTGFAISSIFGAGMNVILIFWPDAYIGAGNFLTGGLIGISIKDISAPAVYMVIGMFLAMVFSRELHLISLGDGIAKSLGVRTVFFRLFFMALAALLAGAATSFGGLIGFVGLIVPHTTRFLLKGDYKYFLSGCALLGAAFVVFADFLARTLFSPYEIPVGILLALMGGPFFIFIIIRNRGGRDD